MHKSQNGRPILSFSSMKWVTMAVSNGGKREWGCMSGDNDEMIKQLVSFAL